MTDRFLENLNEVIDIKTIDYVVMNHMEPDHSGALPIIMEYIPNATVIAFKRGEETIKRHFHKNWRLKVVANSEKINIGKNELIN